MCQRWEELTLDRCHAAHINTHAGKTAETLEDVHRRALYSMEILLSASQKTTCYICCSNSDMLKLQEGFPRKLRKAPISFWHFQCRALMEKQGIFPGIFGWNVHQLLRRNYSTVLRNIYLAAPFQSLFTQQEVERLFFRIWNWKQQQQQQRWCIYVHVGKLKHKLLHSIFILLCCAGQEVRCNYLIFLEPRWK